MRSPHVNDISEIPLILGPSDCARLLGISVQALLHRRKAGDFPRPFNRFGRAQWHREAVVAYLRGGQVPEPVQAQVA